MNKQFIKALEKLKIKPGFKAQILQIFTGTRVSTELWGKDRKIFCEKYLPDSTLFHTHKGKYTHIHLVGFDPCVPFSDMQLGLIYGYPETAIAAWYYPKERHTDFKKKSVAQTFIGPGFPSKKYFNTEKKYYDGVWKKIKKMSPVITHQCEEEYKRLKS